jgi:plastocyanin
MNGCRNNGRAAAPRFAYVLVATMVVSSYAATAAAAPTVQMDIKSFAFSKPDLTITPGTTVVWTNRDEAPHTVTSGDHTLNSKALDTGDSFSFTFARRGDYPYFCTLHPRMVGVVHVVARK